MLASSTWQSVLATMKSTPSTARLDHRVDRVAAAAADPHHLDDGTSGTLGFVVEFEHGRLLLKIDPTTAASTLIFHLFFPSVTAGLNACAVLARDSEPGAAGS